MAEVELKSISKAFGNTTVVSDLNLKIEDGWVYFIHGWTRVIAEVFDIDIPVKGPQFDQLSEIAGRFR